MLRVCWKSPHPEPPSPPLHSRRARPGRIRHHPAFKGSLHWVLWFERQGRYAHGKCQLRLLIGSKLRSCSWLLRECGVPLHTLTYEELRLITEGKIREARRTHVRGRDTLMRRADTPPTCYASQLENLHPFQRV